MYKFVKVRDNRIGLVSNWKLYCNDIIQLIEHTEKYCGRLIGQGIEEYFTNNTGAELKSNWAKLCVMRGEKNKTPFYIESTILENTIYKNKANCIFKNGHVLLNDNGSYMYITDSDEIVETVEKEQMIYPHYSKSDIEIKKFENGKHYYAFIGKLEVVDEDGNKKWNTYEYAEKMAIDYLNNLNTAIV